MRKVRYDSVLRVYLWYCHAIKCMVRHKNARFDTEMIYLVCISLHCNFKHRSPPYWNYFSNFIRTSCFKEPIHRLKRNYHCRNCAAVDPGGQCSAMQSTKFVIRVNNTRASLIASPKGHSAVRPVWYRSVPTTWNRCRTPRTSGSVVPVRQHE